MTESSRPSERWADEIRTRLSSRACGVCPSRKRQGERQDKAVVVVRELADQVHASRSRPDSLWRSGKDAAEPVAAGSEGAQRERVLARTCRSKSLAWRGY